MDASKISERTRRQLEQLPPEKRAKAEEAIARTQSPEYRAKESAERAAMDREYRETGRITTIGESVPAVDLEHLRVFLATLRRERENQRLSLADIAERTGMDKGALSRLENGRFLNFTFATLARYARALGKRFALSLEDPTPKGVNPLAMKVNLDPAIQNNPQVAELIEHVNALLADELGTSAALTTATWMLLHDQGRPLYRLELKDAWGQASIDLASDQIEEPEHLRAALQRLRGNLLQCAASH